MATPGMLCVTMQPKPELLPAQFHEWYNNEHGPTRLRLPQIFGNGLRYQAIDGKEPTFLAAYDVTLMSHLETETYLTLRANRSPREADTIGQVAVTRYFWDLVESKQSPDFVPSEKLSDEEAEGTVLVVVEFDLTDEANAEAELLGWYKEEHLDMLSKVPGWLRSRVFKTSSLETGVRTSYIGYHEYAKQNGLGGPAHEASRVTPRAELVKTKYATLKNRRTYSLFYVFGPGPRDLSSLSQLPAATSTFTSADGKTTTTNSPEPVISSHITTSDGLSIPYLLEGNPDPKAPVISFCNSLLTSLHMWDPLVKILKAKRPQYRLLRIDSRGRHAVPTPPVPVTLDMLSDDLKSVMEALRIPKLETLIGVSCGGATTLRFALKYPELLNNFIACDFNAASSPANTNAWKERITVAETPLEDGRPGIHNLAGVTVERWFHPETMKKTEIVNWMVDMVAANDVQGFRYGCQALWDYDMKSAMKDSKVPGLFVVGEGDGKGALVKAMDGFRGNLGQNGGELAIVPDAGHLPMCENPEGFWTAIEKAI
ncbi:Alpha/Beta hydrolase protein [Xylariales sp. PMI_506]|nr:Alpha/Beta hydrolase protein [Xylariales sp. PMI_506]